MAPAPDAAGAAGPVQIVVLPDAEAAARRAAEELARAARAGDEIALSGGSTPRRAYELAAALEPDWSRARVWLGDERVVPPDDERANARLVREALLERLAVQPRAVVPVRTELGAAGAAAALDEALAGVELGVALLGLGPDGHTASLFPGKAAVGERARRAVASEPGLEPWVERVTMTVPLLCAARRVVYLVTGAAKAEVAARAFAGPADPAVPASLVRSSRGATIAVLDAGAAAALG